MAVDPSDSRVGCAGTDWVASETSAQISSRPSASTVGPTSSSRFTTARRSALECSRASPSEPGYGPKICGAGQGQSQIEQIGVTFGTITAVVRAFVGMGTTSSTG